MRKLAENCSTLALLPRFEAVDISDMLAHTFSVSIEEVARFQLCKILSVRGTCHFLWLAVGRSHDVSSQDSGSRFTNQAVTEQKNKLPSNGATNKIEKPDLDHRRRTKDEGRRTKDEGRRTKDEGRRTNDKRRTTNDEGRRTKDEGRTTNNERRTTNDERRTTNDERRTTNDERRTTNDERRTAKVQTTTTMTAQRQDCVGVKSPICINPLDDVDFALLRFRGKSEYLHKTLQRCRRAMPLLFRRCDVVAIVDATTQRRNDATTQRRNDVGATQRRRRNTTTAQRIDPIGNTGKVYSVQFAQTCVWVAQRRARVVAFSQGEEGSFNK